MTIETRIRMRSSFWYDRNQDKSLLYIDYFECYFCKIAISPLEPLCLVVEFVPGGSLDKLLRRSQVHSCVEEEHPLYANIWSRLTERELLQIAADIANGMKHLECKLVSDKRKYSQNSQWVQPSTPE